MSKPNPTFEDENLSALLDDELSTAERTALEARIAADPGLQAELDALREARSLFAAHLPVAAPAGLMADILAAADEEENKVVPLAWYRKPLGVPMAGWAVAAAAVLVVYVALPDFQGGEPTETAAAARAPMAAQKAPPQDRGYGSTTASNKVQEQQQQLPGAVGDLGADEANDDAVAMVEKPEISTSKGADKKLNLDLPIGKALTTKQMAWDAKKAESKAVAEAAAAEEAQKKAEGKRKVAESGEGEATEQTGFAQVPYEYTLYTDDSQALMQLAAVAGRYQGNLSGPNDKVLELEELTGGEAATVIVKLPAHALQDFGRSIEGLGNVYASADNRVFAGDPVEVRVKVKLAAGRPGTAEQVKPAAKNRKQVDQLEAVGQSL